MSHLKHPHHTTKAPERHTTKSTSPSIEAGLPQQDAPLSHKSILNLQRMVGNHTVQRMLAVHQNTTPRIQRSEEGTLSDEQVAAAVTYNQARGYSEEICRQIQQAVGVNDDGVLGDGTARAVAAWQAQQPGMKIDGKVGPTTLARLVPPQDAPAEAVPETTPAPAETPTAEPEQGGIIEGIIGGLGDAWDSLVDGATNAWDGIAGYFGGEETTPAPTEEPTENDPAQPQPSELDQLMMKERLTPAEIARARELIDQVTDENARGDLYEALQAKVEYANQRDNESVEDIARSGRDKGDSAADAMCNLTSLAMALSYLGVPNPDPTKQYEDALEDIRVKQGFKARTNNAEGWGAVADYLGVTAEFDHAYTTEDKEWYMKNVNPKLREGYAVMMSVTEHIVRVQAVTEEGLIIDDPYGVINLEAGKDWSYDEDNKNAREGEDTNRGEDSVWKWDAVKAHEMQWFAFLKK